MKPYIFIGIMAVSMVTGIGYYAAQQMNNRDQGIMGESKVLIDRGQLPHSYMTIVINANTLNRYDKKTFEAAKAKWCREGHEGNQVLIVMRGGFRLMTFEELKRCGSQPSSQ